MIHPKQLFSKDEELGVDSDPPGDICQCLKTPLIVITEGGGAPGIYWIETTDAAEYLTIHSIVPQTKCHAVQNVSNSNAEKPNVGI